MGRNRSSISVAALIVATGAVAAIAAVSAGAKGIESARAATGGTYKVGWENAFGFTDSFDPTGEYLVFPFGIYSNLMIRTLAGYNHVAGPAGNKLVPDLAVSLPKPTNGGKTYTFQLKPGIKFGPPVSRAVTSKDVLYAFERLAKPKDGGQYSFYYTVIKGFTAYGVGKAKAISGIQTPNDSTIVFNLTQPAGDFLYRLAMPATGPIPEEVAGCFEGKPGQYGRDVVSTGPYMIEGMDKVDDSSCSKLKPAIGFDGQTFLRLVRNPDYDAKTDSPAARESLPDEFQFTINPNISDVVNKVSAGQLDDEIAAALPPQTLERYEKSSSLKRYLIVKPADLTFYIFMNLTQPPFDDIHVRRALNWVMDKAALLQAWGGPLVGRVANHIAPDTIFNNELAEYAPYKTPDDRGSLEKAKAAMAGSKYDTKRDGTCAASQCRNVLLLADTFGVDPKVVAVMRQSAAKLGITFTVRSVRGAFPTLQNVSKNIAIAGFPGWGKDYADPLTFFQPLFGSGSIIPNGNVNTSLVGITPAIATKTGAKGTVTGIPSVDTQLARCSVLSGAPRAKCYEDLDKYLMTQVVPWVPYDWQSVAHIISPNVTQWGFDQFSDSIAYAHVAVKP
jgi:peptide/nickel transport system substrate-binding protein